MESKIEELQGMLQAANNVRVQLELLRERRSHANEFKARFEKNDANMATGMLEGANSDKLVLGIMRKMKDWWEVVFNFNSRRTSRVSARTFTPELISLNSLLVKTMPP